MPSWNYNKVRKLIIQETTLNQNDFHLAYCPERVIPGNILKEITTNARVVGGYNSISTRKIKNFYKSFCKGEISETNTSTAELVKLTENAYRDVNIAFANELSMICDSLNINHNELIGIANRHPRVSILQPGCGVGGHCIAVDPWFIASSVPDNTNLIQTARLVNNNKTEWVTSKIIQKAFQLKLRINRKPKIGCLGITFKPNVDDMRGSPALKIVNNLRKNEFEVIVCEPNINSHHEIKLLSLKDLKNEADLIVILVAHDEFNNFLAILKKF